MQPPPNKSLQPTSVASLRSSPSAAELNRYAALPPFRPALNSVMRR